MKECGIFVRILEMFLLWMVLYNYIITLSMYVSLKLQKFIASHQFQWTNVATYTLLGPAENFSNYSAQTLVESTFLVLNNTLYTSVPVMIYDVLEQNLPETTLMSNPKLYRKNRGNALMSRSYLAQWTLLGL